DAVALANRGDWAAQCCFWRYVADHQAASCSAEASVGNQRYAFAQTFAHNRRGHAQHFAHAGSALRTFIADHHYIPGLDLLAGHGLHCGFFGIKDARWTGLRSTLMAAHLYYATAGSEIAFQDDEPARGF